MLHWLSLRVCAVVRESEMGLLGLVAFDRVKCLSGRKMEIKEKETMKNDEPRCSFHIRTS